MHTKEELDIAVIKLYEDYKEAVKKYKQMDASLVNKLIEINNDEKKYTKEEVYYIGFNALVLLQNDINNNRFWNIIKKNTILIW